MTTEANPQVRAFFDPATNTVSYLVVDPETKHGAVVDPVLDYDQRTGKASTRSADSHPGSGGRAGRDHRLGAGDPRPRRPSVRRALRQAEDRRQGRHRRAHPRGAEDLPAGVQRHRRLRRRQRVRPPVRGGRALRRSATLDATVLHTPGHTPGLRLLSWSATRSSSATRCSCPTTAPPAPTSPAATRARSTAPSSKLLALPDDDAHLRLPRLSARGPQRLRLGDDDRRRARNVQLDGVSEDEFVEWREGRDAKLAGTASAAARRSRPTSVPASCRRRRPTASPTSRSR